MPGFKEKEEGAVPEEGPKEHGPMGYTTCVQDEDAERDVFWENVAMGLVGLIALYIGEQRKKSDADLIFVAERADYLITRKADAFQQGERTTGVLSALAAGMAVLARRPGGVTAFGVHACTHEHEECSK